MLGDAAIPLVSALVAVGTLVLIGTRLGLGRARVFAGALAGGALVGLFVSEIAIDGAGRWWADHPVIAAEITGLLLLALTVLVIEAVVERTLRAAEERRWMAAAASALLADLNRPLMVLHSTMLWVQSSEPMPERAMPKPQSFGPSEGDVARFGVDVRKWFDAWPPRKALNEIRDRVLNAASVLTATDRLHEIYDHAIAVVGDAEDLVTAMERWVAEDIRDYTPATADAVDRWRSSTLAPWGRLSDEMRKFEEGAVERLGIELDPEMRTWKG